MFFQRVAFVGTSNSMIDLIAKIENQNNIYKNIVGYFDTSKKDVENDYLGSIDSIVDSIQNFNIDEIIISESDVNKLIYLIYCQKFQEDLLLLKFFQVMVIYF